MPIADSLRAPQESSDDMPVGQNLTNSDLKNLQSLLYRLITAPEGAATGLAVERAHGPRALQDLEDLIEGDDRLSAVERLDIYANAYFHRILECLKEDFPATLATLGRDNFHIMVTGYLIEYPPTEPSISYAGRHLAEFLCHHPFRERWPFIGELARLERTLIEVFHGEEAEPLNAESMRSVAPDDWPTLTMRTHPAVAILDCEWRVDELLRELQATEGESVQIHSAPVRAPVSVLVWRRDSWAHYRTLERPERAALELASVGAGFAAICDAAAALCAEVDPEGDPVVLINRLLARWIDEGLLVLAGR